MRVVELEATNRCNTRCLHCPHETISRPQGLMPWGTFQVVADKILAHGKTTTVDFAGMGEPTLNPNLYRFIAYFSGKVNTYITTNASALTPRNIERLIEAGLTVVIVSFNGAEPELYETMMGGLSFRRAESYLTDLVRRAQGRMRVVANVSVTRQTGDHLGRIKEYLNDVGVQNVTFSKCHSRGGHLKAPQICDTPMPPFDTGRCDIYAQTLFVAWTGDVLACCHDLDGAAPVGSLLTESVQEILARKQAVLQQGVRYKMCGDCNDLYRFAQDPLPDDRSIADWVYNLYLEPQERVEFLEQVIEDQKNRIEGLSLLSRLEAWPKSLFQGGRDSGDHQGGSDGSSGDDFQGPRSEEVRLIDWMSLLYRQADESTAELFSIIQAQQELIEELSCRSKIARTGSTARHQINDWAERARSRLYRLRRFVK